MNTTVQTFSKEQSALAYPKLPDSLADRYRVFADQLQASIDVAMQPKRKNLSPASSRKHQLNVLEGRNLQRTHKAFRAISSALDAGTLPDLGELRRDGAGIGLMVQKGFSNRSTYYTIIEADEYTDRSPAARILEGLLGECKLCTPQQAARNLPRKAIQCF